VTGGKEIATYSIRKARIEDVPTIAALVKVFADQNLLLPRSEASLYPCVRDFFVGVDDAGQVVACGALAIISDGLAEVRTLAVSHDRQGTGLGRRLVEAALEEARDLRMAKVFALTRAPEFFERLGFVRTDMQSLPQKVWKDCIHCPLFPDCDEIALIREP